MKIIFAGTPEFAAVALQALINSEHEIVAVYTQPDRPAGRGQKVIASPVKQLAEEHGIPVFQPASLKGEAEQEELRTLGAELMVVVAYGLLLPKAVLEAPRYGCINIHGSILPRWRGAAPIQRAILAGDRESGVTIMQMEEGLDTGPMLLIKTCEITPEDTGSSLHDKLAYIGAQALLEVLENIPDGLTPEIQDDAQATYAKKLDKKEALIDWTQSAQSIVHKIQAFNSWPVAWTEYQGQALRLWRASAAPSGKNVLPGTVIHETADGIDIVAGDGVVRVHELQLPGKKRILARDFINGQSLLGEVLGSTSP